MCGITGYLKLNKQAQIEESILSEMNQAQFHRGPDEGDQYVDDYVGLAHRRLSIIDVSTGQQPMTSQDNDYVIVFNGEVYNFVEVREELKALGHTFNTHSDTEVILNAYVEWGPQSVEKLRGMFSYVIWHKSTQSLFVARDRLGIKPLFYTIVDDIFYFASELKSLKLLPNLDRTIDIKGIEQYFAFGYVAEPNTIYQAVHKLCPGHTIFFNSPSEKMKIEQYWDVSYANQTNLSEEEYLKQVVDKLQTSIDSHMVSEVPLGSFLSGGVDSSAVVAMMSKSSEQPVKTCSIGFDVKDYNETDFARMVAKQYQTDHQEHVVKSDDFDLLDKLAELYDEPYADSSAMPTYRVCELARKKVTVCMSGDGADELLAGYRRYALMMNEQKVRDKIPASIRKVIFKPLGKLYPKLDWAPRFLRAKTTFQSLAMDIVEGYFHGVSIMNDDQRRALFSSNTLQQLGDYHALDVFRHHEAKFDGNDPLSLIQYLDIKTYLVGDILTKVDRASMAHSLEVRVPFLDHEFVEWSATVPTKVKLKSGQGKYVLKKAMEDYLPHDVLYRDKMGFRVPLSDWFKGPLKDKLKEALLSQEMRDSGLFNMDTIREWIDDHQSGRKEYSAPLWTLLMFASFYRQATS
ncbi:XrtA/PEP-CTERM system amidotransferase [Colwelliaceae bacterium 6441]